MRIIVFSLYTLIQSLDRGRDMGHGCRRAAIRVGLAQLRGRRGGTLLRKTCSGSAGDLCVGRGTRVGKMAKTSREPNLSYFHYKTNQNLTQILRKLLPLSSGNTD